MTTQVKAKLEDHLPYAEEYQQVLKDLDSVPFLSDKYKDYNRKLMVLQTARAKAAREAHDRAKLKLALS